MTFNFKNYKLEIPVILGAIAVFLLGLEPFVPQISTVFPTKYASVVVSVLGLLISVAHIYQNRPANTFTTTNLTDVASLAETVLPIVIEKVVPTIAPASVQALQTEINNVVAVGKEIAPLAQTALTTIQSGTVVK